MGGDETPDFTCISAVPLRPGRRRHTWCAELRVWRGDVGQYVILKSSTPTSQGEAMRLAVGWAADHKCEYRERR